ncbi:MAG: branched-chain amino acid ABC transporter permease [Chthoniobacterales bacterium]
MGDFFQQLVNGLSLGAIYALIALGYTLVYGVLRFINFAHGDVLMIGSYAGFYVAKEFSHKVGAPLAPGAAIIVFLAAMVICAVTGVIIERLAYRPLRNHAKLTVLITSIGVSLLLSYGGQIVFGASQKPFPQLVRIVQIPITRELSISSIHLIVIITTGILLVTLRLIVMKTRFGLAVRALSMNPQAAALMGVNPNTVISWTFALGSSLAGAAGILYSMSIQSIDPLMGTMPGIKGFIAAVLGGIGNIPGAALGGFIMGIVETYAGGSVISSYRDAIAFGILILILLVKPAGLLGNSQPEKV